MDQSAHCCWSTHIQRIVLGTGETTAGRRHKSAVDLSNANPGRHEEVRRSTGHIIATKILPLVQPPEHIGNYPLQDDVFGHKLQFLRRPSRLVVTSQTTSAEVASSILD